MSATVNLSKLQNNLNEVNYPISREELLRYAEEKGVDEVILRALKQLPSKQYQTLTDVSQAIGGSE
ncbi:MULTISPECIES: DUF2795 domain-containing protein [Nostoc]|uniref:DUF2795 domain-containing protein n=1 Tax=Nostoc paludosum FACHB-159 TaxID=2692908 RepID=A0ABR8K8R5_9NOSO|nr:MULTISPECIES: DUF2795 domain-containing protein [Nostoc]MBD2680246.1 DUF2795 domain-containing protein [Nostoc sp. FACHB-857]MBD2735872.1 DUF2795 domain-containing protein [Nostoc paludosum FACHB-159]